MDTILKMTGVSDVYWERENNPSILRVEESLRLYLSCIYVDKNLKEIHKAANIFCNTENFLNLHTNQRNYLSSQLKDEISRLIFNYIASVKSLVDHTRNLYKELFGVDKMPEYQPKIDELSLKPIVNFVHDLRNYVTHYRPLDLHPNLQFSPNDFRITIGLNVDVLRQWKKWTIKAKEFLESKNDIDILETLNEYQNIIAGFHGWFRDEQKRILVEDWKVYEEFESRIDEDIVSNLVNKLQELSTSSEVFSMFTFESELASVLPFDFWRGIDEKGGVIDARFDNIFLALGSFSIEESLLTQCKDKIFALITDFKPDFNTST